MKPMVAMAMLAMPMALQAAQAQDGAIGEQAAEELRRIGDGVASLDRGTWLAFWGSFLIGIAVVAAAIVSSWRYARHLSRQVRQAADHFKMVEKDMRVRKRPRLSWTDCAIEAVAALSGPVKEQFISVSITNVGDVSATGLNGYVVTGMAGSDDDLEDAEKTEIRMGAILPSATRRHDIPIGGREGEDADTGRHFRFRIVLRYSGAGNTRHEYMLVGELVGNEVRLAEADVGARA